MSNPEMSEFSGVQATSSPNDSVSNVIQRGQAHLMRRLDSLKNAIQAARDTDSSYVEEWTERLSVIVSAFDTKHASLLETVDAAQWEAEEKRYEKFDRRRCEVSILIKRSGADLCASNTETQQPGVSNSRSKVRLPEIPMPSFNGAWETWPTFRDSFVSMIDGHPKLSDVDKLMYLKRVVTKEAAQLIDAVETTAANYSVAWELLKDRYENKKVLVRRYLNELFAIAPSKSESFEALTILIDSFERTIKMWTILDHQRQLQFSISKLLENLLERRKENWIIPLMKK
ncbi:uncharacterized protein LOC128718285 [Anopheles marshallii]|uniref:uncharacterized protein LOC128718285 n=1 Tax=Anopheles marshallii TaxID=1521116 RepID=UPI00237AAFA6|nr:uncharacterized protein LOC128718285 [Anopheles marshallii]